MLQLDNEPPHQLLHIVVMVQLRFTLSLPFAFALRYPEYFVLKGKWQDMCRT